MGVNGIMETSSMMRESFSTDSPATVIEDEWSDEDNPFQETANLIMVVCYPVIIVLGLFGNCMVILLMFRLPGSTYSIFFNILALADLLLLTIIAVKMLFYAIDLPRLDETGSWQCKIVTLLEYTAPAVSAWMLVALTMLRAASVLWPLRVNAVWTKGMSCTSAGILIVVIFLINCHMLYGFAIEDAECIHAASVSVTYEWFFDIVWPWIDLTQSSFLPFVLLVVSNTVLLRAVFKSVMTDTRLSVQQATQDSRQQKASSMTVTLIVTSISFFVLTMPIAIIGILLSYVDLDDHPIIAGYYEIVHSVSSLMWCSNSAVNFYLYCLTGGKFRAEFLKILFKFLACSIKPDSQ